MVSKLEQGSGYPEMEKILVLSKKLNVSLDYLMLDEIKSTENNKTLANSIIVPKCVFLEYHCTINNRVISNIIQIM